MSQKFKLHLPEIDITQNFPLEKIFITSDLHLFHMNIIKYTERPFEYSEDGCHEMNEFLLKKFDAVMLPVIVTVDSDGYTNYVGKVDRSAYGKTAVPEQAKTYVIKKLITNMHTRVIDPEAQRRFIDECLHVCQGSACRAVQVFLMTGPKLHLPLLPDRILYIFSLAAHIKSQPISSPLVGL